MRLGIRALPVSSSLSLSISSSLLEENFIFSLSDSDTSTVKRFFALIVWSGVQKSNRFSRGRVFFSFRPFFLSVGVEMSALRYVQIRRYEEYGDEMTFAFAENATIRQIKELMVKY